MKLPIHLLTPTRGRASALRRSVDSALSLAHSPERVVVRLAVDDDDPHPYEQEYALVRRGPRLGYRRLFLYYDALAREALGGWHVLWNDDMQMLTLGWDDALTAFGDCPQVVFLRRDETDLNDAAYPAWPRTLFDVLGHVSVNAHNDAWLADVTWRAGQLLGWRDAVGVSTAQDNAIRIFDPPILIHHDRLDDTTAHERDAAYDMDYFASAEQIEIRNADARALARARGWGG